MPSLLPAMQTLHPRLASGAIVTMLQSCGYEGSISLLFFLINMIMFIPTLVLILPFHQNVATFIGIALQGYFCKAKFPIKGD